MNNLYDNSLQNVYEQLTGLSKTPSRVEKIDSPAQAQELGNQGNLVFVIRPDPNTGKIEDHTIDTLNRQFNSGYYKAHKTEGSVINPVFFWYKIRQGR